VIISIYRVDALDANGKTKESMDLIAKSLSKFPNSILVKSYKYLSTKDIRVEEDLVRNHAAHWMVPQFEINKI
jgi:hypothetical protein